MDISVALGGGGARGNSHIGVLRVLENEGFQIRAAAGTSYGALVAVMYAAGYTPDDIEAIFSRVDQSKLYGHLSTDGPSLLGTAGLSKLLDDVLGSRTFEKLRIPCAVVAADVKTGREVILDRGPVKDAILASTAVPSVFPVRQIGPVDLVDGGAVNPVPVSVARALAPSLPVVAVSLSRPLEEPLTMISVPATVPPDPLARFRLNQILDSLLQSIDIVSRMLADLRLKVDKPEVIVHPNVDHIGLLDRVDVVEVAQLGRDAMQEALPQLRKAVSWPNRLRRYLLRRKS
jgi:NTE family protein